MVTPTIGLRARKNERTKTAIRTAALELTLELGFENATVAQIAERADVSPRTVHAWFPSKEDIIVGAADEPRDRLSVELAEGDGDVLQRVRRWVENETEMRTDPVELTRLRYTVLLNDPHLRAVHRARMQTIEEIVAAAIAKDADMNAEAVAPHALAAAVVTSLLALEARLVEGSDPEATRFEAVQLMLRAALEALIDRPPADQREEQGVGAEDR